MPKHKVEGDPLHPQEKVFSFEDFDVEPSVVRVWCDGRNYDPETETYKPQYSYSIVTDKWRYDGNNILGAANELPDLYKASQTLFALLWASRESFKAHNFGAFTAGKHEMFPVQVNEWALQYGQEIYDFSLACQAKSQQS
jgi:hypothetical protein